jgi:hypothetical protein
MEILYCVTNDPPTFSYSLVVVLLFSIARINMFAIKVGDAKVQ